VMMDACSTTSGADLEARPLCARFLTRRRRPAGAVRLLRTPTRTATGLPCVSVAWSSANSDTYRSGAAAAAGCDTGEGIRVAVGRR
jgi:hypothetical protein